jgi:hypothetical protein
LAEARKEGQDILESFIELSKQAVKGDLSKLPQLFTDKQMLIGMRALITSADKMKEFKTALANTDGATLKDLATVLEDNQSRIDRMANSWDRFMSNFGAAVSNPISGALDFQSDQIEKRQALEKGLEDEDLNWFHKLGVLAAPNWKDPLVIRAMKRGGYSFDTFEGGMPETGNIAIPQPAPLAGNIDMSKAGAMIPIARKDYRPANDPVNFPQRAMMGPSLPGAYDKIAQANTDIAFQQPVLTPLQETVSRMDRTEQGFSGPRLQLDTDDAKSSFEEIMRLADQPMGATYELDTSAAEAKLDALMAKARKVKQSLSVGRNLGRSMPEAGQ